MDKTSYSLLNALKLTQIAKNIQLLQNGKMDIAVANVVRKDFYGFDTESPTAGTLFYAKSPRSYEIQ